MTMEKFHYQAGDVEIVLPHFAQLPLGVVRKTRHLADDEKFFVILETLMPEGSPELGALDAMGVDEVSTFMEQWQAAGNVGLGESKDS